MAGFIIGAVIIGYTGFIVYKKTKDLKAGKTRCGGCSSCASCSSCSSKDKCTTPKL